MSGKDTNESSVEVGNDVNDGVRDSLTSSLQSKTSVETPAYFSALSGDKSSKSVTIQETGETSKDELGKDSIELSNFGVSLSDEINAGQSSRDYIAQPAAADDDLDWDDPAGREMVDMTEVQTWLFTIRKWYHVYIFCTGLIIFTLLGLRMEMGVFYALLSTNNSNHDPGTDYTTVLLNISIMIILAVLSAFCVLANALLIQEEYRGLGFMVMRLYWFALFTDKKDEKGSRTHKFWLVTWDATIVQFVFRFLALDVVPIVVGLAMTGDFFAYWVISAVMVGMVLSLVRLFMEFLNFVILAIRHVRENWRRLLVVRFKPVPLSEVVKSYAFFAYEHKLLIEKRVTSWIFTYRLQKAFRYFGGSYWALSILIVIQFVFVGLFEDSQGWIFLCTINYLVIYVLIWRKAAPWSEVAALAETEEDSQSTGDANNKTTEVPQTSAENLSAKPSRLARMASRVAGQDRYSTDLEGCEYIYRFIPDYHVRNRKTWLSLLLPILFISQSIWLCVASVEHQGGVAFIVAYLTVFYGLFWGLFYCFIMALWLKSRKVVRIVERREIAAEYVRIIKAMNEYLIYILMFVSFIGVVCGIVYLTILAEGTFLDGFLLFLAVFLLFSVISTITTKAFRRAYPMEAFWFLFILFVTVGVVLSVFSYSLQQNDDNNDTSEPISLVSAPIAPSPTSFASCDVTFGPTAMSIMDMAYMSKVAYAPMEVVQRELNTWFNANQTDGTGWYIHYNATTDGYPYFYDIRHNTTGMAIISVRGTNSLYDVVMDMDLWLEIAVLQMTDFFLPTLSLWPVELERLVVSFSSFSNEPELLRPLGQYVRDLNVPPTHVLITGHSLGGGLANMVAANYADRNYTTVTFSPPGIKVSGAKYNFDYSTGTLFNRFFIVKPDKDIVPQIDVQKGTVMDIPCYLNALPCHGLSNTINTLATSCGDPAGRRINETT